MKTRGVIFIPFALAGFVAGYVAPVTPIESSAAKFFALAATQQHDHSGIASPAEQPLTPAERAAALAAGLRSALSQVSNAHRTHDLVAFFQDVSADEMAGVADLIMKLPDGARWLAMAALMERWVEVDVQAAAGYLEHARGDRDNLGSALTHAWGLRDPEAAIRWAQQLPHNRRTDAVRSLASTLSWRYRDDPANGVALLLQAGMLSGNPLSGGNLFTAWAKRDPRAAVACAAGLENTKLRASLMDNALKGWAESDPAAAAGWCRQLSDPKLRSDATAAMAVGLAANDLGQSLVLARSLPEGRARDRTLALMADALFWNRRDEALQILEEVPFETGNGALKQIYTNWAFNDAGGAVANLCERLNRLPSGSEERFAIETFLEASHGNFSRTGSDAVVNALASGMPDDGDGTRARMLVKATEKWASQNVADARIWAEALPEGVARERALVGIARGWAGGSIPEVAGWLDALPASPSRDAAVSSFARTVIVHDPAGALAWMRTIPNPQRRLVVLQTAWNDWLKQSPDQAAQWRNTSPDLTAAERSHLTAPR